MPYYFIRSFGIIVLFCFFFFKNDFFFKYFNELFGEDLFHLSINVTFCIGVCELGLVYLIVSVFVL